MDDKEFFDFAYEEYKAELALAYSLHQRAGILLTAIVIVGGAAAAIARIELLGQTAPQWRVLCLHLATLFVVASLIAGVVFLFVTTLPRDYPKLGKAFFWCQWRQRYRAMLVDDDPDDDQRNQSALASATLEAILQQVADAQTTAAWMNQKRLRSFYNGVCCLSVAVIGLGIEGLFAVLLKMKGV